MYPTTFDFDIKETDSRTISLLLGQIKDVGIARVKLNGTDLGVVWRPPFRVNASDAIKPGKNGLDIVVVNSWRNRLIGDLDLPESKRVTKTNIRVTSKWMLEPSGLLGPVVLETQELHQGETNGPSR